MPLNRKQHGDESGKAFFPILAASFGQDLLMDRPWSIIMFSPFLTGINTTDPLICYSMCIFRYFTLPLTPTLSSFGKLRTVSLSNRTAGRGRILNRPIN